MPIPLDTLIDSQENVYQLTCIAIKRAQKIIRPIIIDEEEGTPIVEDTEKIVSQALDEVLHNEVEYQLEETE